MNSEESQSSEIDTENLPGITFDAVTSAWSGAAASMLMSYGAYDVHVSCMLFFAASERHGILPKSIFDGSPSGRPGLAAAAGLPAPSSLPLRVEAEYGSTVAATLVV